MLNHLFPHELRDAAKEVQSTYLIFYSYIAARGWNGDEKKNLRKYLIIN